MTEAMKKAGRETMRMAQWLAVAIALYVVTFEFGLQESAPGWQATICNVAER